MSGLPISAVIICRAASEGALKGILGYTDDDVLFQMILSVTLGEF
jgi:hypothetical protein